jgi:chromosome segregation ATPase
MPNRFERRQMVTRRGSNTNNNNTRQNQLRELENNRLREELNRQKQINQQQMANINNKLSTTDTLQREVEILKTKLSSFENTNNVELMKLKTIVVDNIEKIDGLKETISKLTSSIDELGKNNNALKKKNGVLEKLNTTLKGRNDELDSELKKKNVTLEIYEKKESQKINNTSHQKKSQNSSTI